MKLLEKKPGKGKTEIETAQINAEQNIAIANSIKTGRSKRS